MAGLREPVAEHAAQAHVAAGAAGDRAGEGRPPVQARGLAGALRVRLHQAVLPHRGQAPACHARPGGGARRAHRAEGRLLYAAVHRRARADELRADQSRGAARNDGERRPEPAEGPEQPARRPRARRRRAARQHDRRERLQVGREHRGHPRQGGLPERAPAADPVHADHEAGVPAAAPHRSALDQQVLHPRSAGEQFLRQVGRGAGTHGVHRVLGQPGQGDGG